MIDLALISRWFSKSEPGLRECRINGMRLRVPVRFISMFSHCASWRRRVFDIESAHFSMAVGRLPVGGIAVDVGASGGVFTAGFSRKAGPTGKVYAFEPARTANALLSEMVQVNDLKNVRVEAMAVGAAAGSFDFFELPSSDECNWRPECSALALTDPADDAIRYSVEVTTLNNYFSELSTKIDVLKIDIEGFECHALRGGLRVIERHRPFLAIDIHRNLDGRGDTEAEARGLLSAFGYRFSRSGHVLLCEQ